MKPVSIVTGRVLPVPRADVDTDQIIPARRLKSIERTGFADYAFEAWRSDSEFPLSDPRRAGATILLAGANFGCGSSREHATWALWDLGVRAVVAPSFADIFRANSTEIGLLTVTVSEGELARLMTRALADADLQMQVDLPAQSIRGPGIDVPFAIDPRSRQRLLRGLDPIAETLLFDPQIVIFERARGPLHPSTSTTGATT